MKLLSFNPGAEPHVTEHAVRRYAERVLGIELDVQLTDPHAICELQERGINVADIRRRLRSSAHLGVRLGAAAVIADGVRLLLDGDTVVTCLPRHDRSYLRRAA